MKPDANQVESATRGIAISSIPQAANLMKSRRKDTGSHE